MSNVEYFHYCPQCGTEYKCPCTACNGKGESNHEFLPCGELVRCKVCGFTACFDEMQDIEIMQYNWQEENVCKKK